MTSRTRLDWLVFDRIWTNLQNHVEHEYGQIDGYLSRAVETAMREAVGDHRYNHVEEKVQALVDTVGAKKTDGENSPFDPSDYTGKTRATVYVDKSLLARYKAYADDSQYCYGVKLSQTLLYYLQGGRPDSLAGQLDRALEEIEQEQDDSMTTTEEIAERLSKPFTLAEFQDAADAAGVSTDKYATEQYLPKVLDELDVYPHPGDNDLFIPTSAATIPDTPDPATLPYQAMEDDDKRLALKAAALRKVDNAPAGLAKFSASDGVDALGGRPRHSTVRPLLRDIARESEGFVYDSDIPGLRVSQGDAARADYDNQAALEVVGWLTEDTPESESTNDPNRADPDEDTPDEWVEDVVGRLEDMPADVPDTVVNNKIVRARYPDAVDDVEGPPDDLLESVTDEERDLVKQHLGWDDSVDDSADDVGDVDDEWNRLQEATVVTDGGHKVNDVE